MEDNFSEEMFLVPSIFIDERDVAYEEVRKRGRPKSLYPNTFCKDTPVRPELLVPNCDCGKLAHVLESRHDKLFVMIPMNYLF